MKNEPKYNRVSRSINRPLMIWGVDRRLFLFTAMVGAGTFNLFASLLSGLLVFAALFLLARWAASVDPQLLHIVLNSARLRREYDSARRPAPRRLPVIIHDLGR